MHSLFCVHKALVSCALFSCVLLVRWRYLELWFVCTSGRAFLSTISTSNCPPARLQCGCEGLRHSFSLSLFCVGAKRSQPEPPNIPSTWWNGVVRRAAARWRHTTAGPARELAALAARWRARVNLARCLYFAATANKENTIVWSVNEALFNTISLGRAFDKLAFKGPVNESECNNTWMGGKCFDKDSLLTEESC